LLQAMEDGKLENDIPQDDTMLDESEIPPD